jgi:hypothetical protein
MTLETMSELNAITFKQVAERFPPCDGLCVSQGTVWRWWKFGCRTQAGERVRLKAWKLGGRLVTTVAAVNEFLAAVNVGVSEPAAAAAV